MNSKIFNSIVVVLCGILFCLISANIGGNWTGSLNYNGNQVPLAYDFKLDGNTVTGTSESPLGKVQIEDGKVENDNLSFKVNLNGQVATHTGKIYPDSITLTINYQGADYQTTLKRKAMN